AFDLELVFVDDGSGDGSLALLRAEQEKDPRIKIVKLSRNFGSVAAIQAGLLFATGDCVGVIAADLQDPPELFVDMIAQWEQGKKVVLAVREGRKDGIIHRCFSGGYYLLMRRFAVRDYPKGGFDFVLMDKQIVEEINNIKEKNTNIDTLIFWLGHERAALPYVRQKRRHGKSRWTLSKKVKLFIDSFVSFSYAPIRLMSLIGLVTAGLSFVYGIVAIVNAFRGQIPVRGWTTLIVVMTFLLGSIMVMLGIIGEYLWRILDEVRNRPAYVIDEVFLSDDQD
ncbi:unnamed protein product, partial [marine sediment metagenome]